MSLLSNILGHFINKDETESILYPCQNCESSCKAYPNACEECKPYKEQLINALYNVANIDAFYAKYEIVSPDSAPAGTVICPFCNASTSGTVCEYCGSKIAESSGKIQVASASEIPNPIMDARDIIYNRRAVIDKYTETSESDASGILDTIVSALTDNGQETAKTSSLGSAMTESEIKTMAEKYGVSVRDYLEGLDMGTYLSKTAYEKQQNASTSNVSGVAAGAAGIAAGAAGIGTAAGIGMTYGNQNRPQRPRNDTQMSGPDMRCQENDRPHGNRPPMNDRNSFHGDRDRSQDRGGQYAQHGSHGGGPSGGPSGGRRGGENSGRKGRSSDGRGRR